MGKVSIAKQFFNAVDDNEKQRIKTRFKPDSKELVHKDLTELFYKPVTFKSGNPNNAQIQVFKENEISQADLLFLPFDEAEFKTSNKRNKKHKRGYKYLLVVTDIYNGKTDCEPLENKTSEHVSNAFEKIYSRTLKRNHQLTSGKPKIKLVFSEHPREIQTDSGNEFKGEFKDYCIENNIKIRYGLTNRHKMQAFVENKNKLYSRILSRQMANDELLSGTESKSWVEYLPLVTKIINQNLKKPISEPISPFPIDTAHNRVLIPEGSKVRILLDHPESVLPGTKLYGKFREGDIRWSREIYTIDHILLKPGIPPQYLVKDSHGETDWVARPKNELQRIINFV